MRHCLLPLTLLRGLSVPAQTSDVRLFEPAFKTDFPDPFNLHDGAFIAYATNAQGDQANVQMASWTDLVDWQLVKDGEQLRDAMPVPPPWARPSFTWAPEVIATDAGFVLHFPAKDRTSGLQCLGAAFSTDPDGPFTSQASKPLLCQTADGGTIDSSPFRDADGMLFLYY